MNGFLLDTNVVSELTRTEPNSNVIAFLSEHQDLWLSAVVLHKLEFGLQLLPDGQRRDLLSAALAGIVNEYQDRIVPVDREVAERAAAFRAQAHRGGRALDLGDALIAGTARAHDLSVTTRNVADFSGLDVRVINPWERV
ncbi:MAG: type II toxin-antitoxin system VapC family toxin [Gemmatimonadota bacterium]|nr:type II toxin-antitoxin system VapC family toxin [Gemmatimonadota bacterium]